MGVLLPVLLFVSVALIVLSRLDHGYIGNVRWKVAELISPVLRAAMVPLEPIRTVATKVGDAFTTVAEIERLRDEAQVMKGWEWRAKELERKLSELAATARTARETQVDFITVRVIANSSGAFVRSAMINAGGDQRLKPGHPVLSGDGLVGRIVDTGSNAARVLLLTDAQSRIPVYVGPQAVRAVLAGDNGPRPRLVFTAPDSVVKPGDEVSTSGIGGLFPRGLRIGAVMEAGERPTVKPHADLDVVEYLSVLLFETPELDLIDPDPPPRAALKEAKP
jgi:rod shape-determining protein MreC